MIYSYFDFGRKNSSFWLPYQRPISATDCARELFESFEPLIDFLAFLVQKL